VSLCDATLTRASTSSAQFCWSADPLYTFRGSPSGTQSTLQIPLSTSTAREFLVALRFGLCAIATSDRRSAGRLRYYPLRRKTLFVILVATVYGVMALQEVAKSMLILGPGRLEEWKMTRRKCKVDVPTSKTHVTGEAFERLDVGIYPYNHVSPGSRMRSLAPSILRIHKCRRMTGVTNE
jgi:hypothetical protein